MSIGPEWLGYTEKLNGAACYQHPTLPPDAWFPSTTAERRFYEADVKAACGSCPVRVTCLDRALEEEAFVERHGIRGGLNEDERAAIVADGAA